MEMNKHWVEESFEECGAILNGHFVLNSGRHSKTYLEKTMIYSDGQRISDICFEMGAQVAMSLPDWNNGIEVVVGPAIGGIILSHEVSKRLSGIYNRSVFSVFTEKDNFDNQVFKRPGFKKLLAGASVLIVDDILTTGGSVNKVIKAVLEAGGNPAAVVVICNRGGVQTSDVMNYPLFQLWQTSIEDWAPDKCPLCQAGVPITNVK